MLNSAQKVSLFLLRVGMGWLFLYAGFDKLRNPAWSAAGYIKRAKLFTPFYSWLAEPTILPVVNFLNEWGLTLIGLSLILGIFVRLSSYLGVIMMLLYYFAISTFNFPYPTSHSFLVEEHIIYSAALIVLAAFEAGRVWGLEPWCSRLPICSRYPVLRRLLG